MIKKKPDSFRLVRHACRVAEDKLGQDILALDVRQQSSVADAFVFITCTSHLHIRAVEDALREALKEEGGRLVRTDGQRGHLWRALDYGSFLVHIMDQKTRDHYAIERLWDRSKAISVNAVPAKKGVKEKRSKRVVRPVKKGKKRK